MTDAERPRGLPEHLTPAEKAALGELLGQARACLGGELLEVRLFGSRARGEGTADSDLDVALIVTATGRARRNEIYDLAFELQLQHGVRLAPLVIERARLAELRARERVIAAALDREGIRL